MKVEYCPTRAQLGPLMPERITVHWNRFTEYLQGADALEYLRLLRIYLPQEAKEKILDLPWQVE